MSKDHAKTSWKVRRNVFSAWLSCSLWMFVSTLTVLENKRIMSDLGFGHPMTTSALGMCFSSLATWIMHVFGAMEEKKSHRKQDASMLLRVMFIGILSSSSLYFGNVPYLYLSVSFIQLLKSLTPAVTLVAMLVCKLQKASSGLYASILLITIGGVLTGLGEVRADAYGTTMFMLSILCESIRVVCLQALLKSYSLGPAETLLYVAPASAFFLCVGAVVLESRSLVEQGGIALLRSHPLRFLFVSSLGFLTNMCSIIVIRITSPLTLKVVAHLKSMITILMGILLYRDVVTPMQWIGYALSVGGFVLYVWCDSPKTVHPNKVE